ncbi:M14 family zinc carboxypeptidase [Streptomyces sp. TR06-5]|uniref:M14 family zinc carboxypeptidase n=1 Tax=unclassified Streptomyces TaxID=2593676 RepID=UPI0039A052E6
MPRRPAWDRHPTVDEVVDAARTLAAERPELCRMRDIGASRAGEPLRLLSVGRGRHNCLVVAGPHANEPVGGATAVALARRVVDDPSLHTEAEATWHFLLCLDPDGTRRNESAPSVPGTFLGEHLGFFRPTGAEQPEWAPAVRKPGDALPESRALFALIEDLRPFLQCSLHGHDIGGSWVQLTRDLPGLGEPFAKSAAMADIPVEHGAFDTLLWSSAEPGVCLAPPSRVRERFPALVEDVDRSTWGAPHRYGGLTAAVEVPTWASRLVEDAAAHPAPSAALRECAARLRDGGRAVRGLLAEAHTHGGLPDGPVHRAVQAALAGCDGLAHEWEHLAGHDPYEVLPMLTEGHLLSSEGLARRLPLRAAVMLRRLVDTDGGAAVRHLRDRAGAFAALQSRALERRFRARPVPVGHQVRHQGQTVVEVFRRALPPR